MLETLSGVGNICGKTSKINVSAHYVSILEHSVFVCIPKIILLDYTSFEIAEDNYLKNSYNILTFNYRDGKIILNPTQMPRICQYRLLSTTEQDQYQQSLSGQTI